MCTPARGSQGLGVSLPQCAVAHAKTVVVKCPTFPSSSNSKENTKLHVEDLMWPVLVLPLWFLKKQEYVKDLLQLCHVPPKPTQPDPWRCHKKHCPLLGVQKCSCIHMLSQRDLLCLHKGPCSSFTTVTIPVIVAARKPPAKLINLLPSRQSKLSLSSVAQWI